MAPYLLLRSLIELGLRRKVMDRNDLLADVLTDLVELTENRAVVTANVIK